MLALCLTFLAAGFILAPDLLFRWILSFVVPRRSISQNRGEEITRAIFWALGPLALVIGWVRWQHVLQRSGHFTDVQVVFSGLYSNNYFEQHTQTFFDSLFRVAGMTGSMLWRLYLIVAVVALTLNVCILRYRWLRSKLKARWMQKALTTLVLPRISEWHVLLSDMLLLDSDASLAVDVLTKSGTLYQGGVQDKMLGPDGSLMTITLVDPRRFLREDFHQAEANHPGIKREAFWRPIEGKLFVIFGSDIANVNVRYLSKSADAAGLARLELSANELNALKKLLAKMEEPVRNDEEET